MYTQLNFSNSVLTEPYYSKAKDILTVKQIRPCLHGAYKLVEVHHYIDYFLCVCHFKKLYSLFPLLGLMYILLLFSLCQFCLCKWKECMQITSKGSDPGNWT